MYGPTRLLEIARATLVKGCKGMFVTFATWLTTENVQHRATSCNLFKLMDGRTRAACSPRFIYPQFHRKIIYIYYIYYIYIYILYIIYIIYIHIYIYIMVTKCYKHVDLVEPTYAFQEASAWDFGTLCWTCMKLAGLARARVLKPM